MSRTLRKKVFLKEHCPHCGHKVHRQLDYDRRNDDACQELIYTVVEDRCEGPCKIPLRAAEIPWPCMKIEAVFDDYEAQKIPRRKFDAGIEIIFRQNGGRWESQVS